MLEITIRADTPEEMMDLLRRINAIPNRPTPMMTSEPASGDLQSFLASRSTNQRKVIDALRGSGGQLHLRALERQIGVTGLRLAGTLASLNRSGKSLLGCPVIEPGPWFVNDSDEWDREYRLAGVVMNNGDGSQHGHEMRP